MKMVDKLLAIVTIVVVIGVAFVLLQSSAKPTLPNLENTGDSTCNLPASSCSGSVLTFYRCSNGSTSEQQYDCKLLSDVVANWTCNPTQVVEKNGERITRANCDVVQAAGQEQNGSEAASAESSTGDLNGEQSEEQNAGGLSPPQRAPPLAYCGNDYVDADETCVSCLEDFKCTSQEFCDNESGLCTKINSFGDDRCTQEENRTGVDCSSCGCSENNICNEVSKRCQDDVPLTAVLEVKIDGVVNATLSNRSSIAYLGLVDTIYANQSAKMAVFDCDTTETFFCRTFVIIDRNGNVLETVHTS